MSKIRVFSSIAANMDWPLYQLNTKNTFLYKKLQEKVNLYVTTSWIYIQLSGRMVWLVGSKN